jgi:hypothetical protein
MNNAPETQTTPPAALTTVADAAHAPASWRTRFADRLNRLADWCNATGDRISGEPGSLWPPLAARPSVGDKPAIPQRPKGS